MNKVKNVHSPAGMGFRAPGLTNLTDCPKCKYGTVDRKVAKARPVGTGDKEWMECADCGAEWTMVDWVFFYSHKK